MFGLSDGLIYLMYTVVFRFAAFVVTLEPDSVAFATYKDIVTYVAMQVAKEFAVSNT